MNPDDVKRDKILRYLYERHKSSRGVSAIPIGIRDLQSEMKKRYGMTQQEVSHNLDYLIQMGWVKEVVKEREFATPGGMTLSREQVKYKISEVGISHLESASLFTKPKNIGQINITNVQGVTVVGNGNVVNTQLTDLSSALDELENVIASSRELTEEQKLDATADIATIRNQIAKNSPNRSIVRAAWDSIQDIVKGVEPIANILSKVWPLISQIT